MIVYTADASFAFLFAETWDQTAGQKLIRSWMFSQLVGLPSSRWFIEGLEKSAWLVQVRRRSQLAIINLILVANCKISSPKECIMDALTLNN